MKESILRRGKEKEGRRVRRCNYRKEALEREWRRNGEGKGGGRSKFIKRGGRKDDQEKEREERK